MEATAAQDLTTSPLIRLKQHNQKVLEESCKAMEQVSKNSFKTKLRKIKNDSELIPVAGRVKILRIDGFDGGGRDWRETGPIALRNVWTMYMSDFNLKLCY